MKKTYQTPTTASLRLATANVMIISIGESFGGDLSGAEAKPTVFVDDEDDDDEGTTVSWFTHPTGQYSLHESFNHYSLSQ